LVRSTHNSEFYCWLLSCYCFVIDTHKVRVSFNNIFDKIDSNFWYCTFCEEYKKPLINGAERWCWLPSEFIRIQLSQWNKRSFSMKTSRISWFDLIFTLMWNIIFELRKKKNDLFVTWFTAIITKPYGRDDHIFTYLYILFNLMI